MMLPGLEPQAIPATSTRRGRRPKDLAPERLVWLVGEGREVLAVRRCPGCRAWILAGWTDGRQSVYVELDPEPLDPIGEVLAWLTPGRRTWTLRRPAGKAIAQWRGRWRITGAPAGRGVTEKLNHKKYDVLADHRCGNRLPSANTAHILTTAVKEECIEPPY